MSSPMKTCPECGTQALPHFTRCKECGFNFPPPGPGDSSQGSAMLAPVASTMPSAGDASGDDSAGAESPNVATGKGVKGIKGFGKRVNHRLHMQGAIKQSVQVIERFVNPKYVKADQGIPLQLLKRAKGLAIISQVKAGFMFSGIVGTGIVLAKLPSGTWSGPCSIGTGGMGWGAMIGASKTDTVIVLNTWSAIELFTGKGQVRLGADIQVAAGPVGRDAAANIGIGRTSVAPAYHYSHTQGLYAGISLEGMVITPRPDDNKKFYGRKVSSQEILTGAFKPPHDDGLKELYDFLDSMVDRQSDENQTWSSTVNLLGSETDSGSRRSSTLSAGGFDSSRGSRASSSNDTRRPSAGGAAVPSQPPPPFSSSHGGLPPPRSRGPAPPRTRGLPPPRFGTGLPAPNPTVPPTPPADATMH